jgi:hypothetical protein
VPPYLTTGQATTTGRKTWMVLHSVATCAWGQKIDLTT